MKPYRADLHIHTVLSPCGDLTMSPRNIVDKSVEQGLSIIGITDHNSTRHCEVISKLAKEKGIFVLAGAEVSTIEEVHCLTFFENFEKLAIFQQYLEDKLPFIKNDVAIFGYQVVVDEDGIILDEIESLLISGINESIDEVERMVHSLNGIFIPAHIDKPVNGIFSQLGIYPIGLKSDGIEISGKTNTNNFRMKYPEFNSVPIIKNSDAHLPENIGSLFTEFLMDDCTFEEIKKAFSSTDGRKVIEK